MVIRITWGKLRAGAWNDFERTYRENVLTKGKGLKGLKGRWLAQDAGDKDTGFAVSLWDNQGDMTEPKVASSDATNIETEIRRDGDQYVISGRKWFTSGIHDPRCKILILMGKTDAKNADRHRQQSMPSSPRDVASATLRSAMPQPSS